MEIGKKFKSIEYYNQQMSLGMKDKLFFIDKLPARDYSNFVFIDFGCADGALIRELSGIWPGAEYIGYDISEQMIEFAKKSFYGEIEKTNTLFTTSWEEAIGKVATLKENQLTYTVLILSSVVHEVYSYAKTMKDIGEFWGRVLDSGFDCIVLREMSMNETVFFDHVNPEDLEKIKRVQSVADLLSSFEERWGQITTKGGLVHFLLKHRWRINWEREVNENYFPIMTDELLSTFMGLDRYHISYLERFRVEFLDDAIWNTFGIQLKDPTHIKAIFVK